MSPEFLLGLGVLLLGTLAAAYPLQKTYLARVIHLEIPAWGLLLLMLAYDEALALFTFGAISAFSIFLLVRVIEKREAA
jgi:energy-converting hydrogenase A subunit E